MGQIQTGHTFAVGELVTHETLNQALNEAALNATTRTPSTPGSDQLLYLNGGSLYAATWTAFLAAIPAGSLTAAMVDPTATLAVAGVNLSSTAPTVKFLESGQTYACWQVLDGSLMLFQQRALADNTLAATPVYFDLLTGNLFLTGQLKAGFKTPASASATGTRGTICADANYVYVCTETDTWKRVALASW